MACSVQMKRGIEESGVGDRRSSILVLALWPYHRGLLSDSIPAGELRGKEFCEWSGVPNKSHEQGQVFLTGGNRERSLFLFLLLHPSVPVTMWSRPLYDRPLPQFFFTVKRLIDSYSWPFNCIQLCGSKKTSPSRYAAALHSNRPRTKAK